MILSMTGYGRSNAEHPDISCQVEIRSVNNRFLKTVIRLPDDMADCEVEIERRLREKLGRGAITVTVSAVRPESAAAAPVNLAAARLYLEQLLSLAQGVWREKPDHAALTIDLAQILSLPGVCLPSHSNEEEALRQRALVLRLTDEAIAQLLQMRRREGQALWRDLREQLAAIGEALENIRRQAPAAARQYHERLRARVLQLVDEAKLSLSDSDLLREVALFSERADISEELTRLAAHLDHFTQVTQADESQVGRTLDFIAQEMLRETNTIGSKCSDGQLARWTLQIKEAINRVKEQVQNVQ